MPCITSESSLVSRMSPSTMVTRPPEMACTRFSRRPRTKLSSTTISEAPSGTSRSAMWEPTRPAPPVISTREFLSIEFLVSSQYVFQCGHGLILLLFGHAGEDGQEHGRASGFLADREVHTLIAGGVKRFLVQWLDAHAAGDATLGHAAQERVMAERG